MRGRDLEPAARVLGQADQVIAALPFVAHRVVPDLLAHAGDRLAHPDGLGGGGAALLGHGAGHVRAHGAAGGHRHGLATALADRRGERPADQRARQRRGQARLTGGGDLLLLLGAVLARVGDAFQVGRHREHARQGRARRGEGLDAVQVLGQGGGAGDRERGGQDGQGEGAGVEAVHVDLRSGVWGATRAVSMHGIVEIGGPAVSGDTVAVS